MPVDAPGRSQLAEERHFAIALPYVVQVFFLWRALAFLQLPLDFLTEQERGPLVYDDARKVDHHVVIGLALFHGQLLFMLAQIVQPMALVRLQARRTLFLLTCFKLVC